MAKGRFNAKTETVYLEDGAGVQLEIDPTQGNFSCSNLFLSGNCEAMNARHRGRHDGWFPGDDVTQEWSIEMELVNQSFTHASAARVVDFIKNHRKGVTALTNVDTSGAGSWTFKVRVVYNDGTNTASVLLPNTTIEIKAYSGSGAEPVKMTISGTNTVEPTYA